MEIIGTNVITFSTGQQRKETISLIESLYGLANEGSDNEKFILSTLLEAAERLEELAGITPEKPANDDHSDLINGVASAYVNIALQQVNFSVNWLKLWGWL